MEIKVKIKTVKGYAKSTQKKLMPFLLGYTRAKHEVYCNKADDTIIWNIQGNVRDVMKVSKRISQFDVMMAKVLKSKKLRKAAKLSEEDKVMLDRMLGQQTEITVIKKANAEELELENKTLWQRIKGS